MEGGKPDTLTREPGYLPAQDDERNTQMEQILLLQHQFKDTKIQAIKLSNMHNKNEHQIQETYRKNEGLQKIRNTQEKGEKEMKAIAHGLCQWKNGYL